MAGSAQSPPGEDSEFQNNSIRWGRFTDVELEHRFQRDRSSSMTMMVLICLPVFVVVALAGAVMDYGLLDPKAFWTLLGWRSLNLVILGVAAWYAVSYRRTLSYTSLTRAISTVAVAILVLNIPISLIYLQELGRSDRLIQIAVFSIIVLCCHPGPLVRVVRLAALAVASIVCIDWLGNAALPDAAQNCVSLLIVVGIAIGGHVVWNTRSRETFLVGIQLAHSEAELRKLREAQARLAVQALRRRDAQWAAVVGETPVVVMTVDRSGVVAFANPKALSLGFRVGTPLDISSTQLDGAWLLSQVAHVFEETQTRSFELVVDQKGSDTSHWTFYAAPVGAKLPTEQVTLVGLDSTEAWRLRFELRRKSRESSLGSVVTSISHDFNNLLMVIAGSAEALSLDPEQSKDAKPLIESILDASHRADELTRRMLKFVQGTPEGPGIHDVNALIEEMTSLLRYVSGTHNTFRFEPSAEPVFVRIDRTELEQVLVNLCANANAAIVDKGRVVLSVVAQRQGRVQIAVADSGVGIVPEVKEKIFEPYFTTRSEHGGSGVGLSTVRELVQSAGGEIRVDSIPGKGTTMRLVFPLAQDDTRGRKASLRVAASMRTGHRLGR